MAYNLKIADRVRECLADLPNIEEKEMMGGIAFMYNSKMCVGVMKDELMCRIDPAQCEQVLEMPGCRPMDFTGKPMRGWILVDETAITTKKKLEYWIGIALDFNKKAKKIQKRNKSLRTPAHFFSGAQGTESFPTFVIHLHSDFMPM